MFSYLYKARQRASNTAGTDKSKSKMATAMKVEIVKRETIKPSSPTPHHLRTLKLNLLDEIAPSIYAPIILFYPFDGIGDPTVKFAERSQRLKNSLSETLTQFYPFAGRFKDANIDCNDDGMEYLEARVNRHLSDMLEQPDIKVLETFLPPDIADMSHVLLVQTTLFECGGMAIGVSLLHKIADAASLSTFLKGWSSVAHDSGEVVVPKFNVFSVFTPIEIKQPALELSASKCITRRYVFDASKITLLKAKAASDSVLKPSRVEVVLALLWKCAMKASRSNLGFARPSAMTEAVNLRNRTVPPLPEHSIGNFLWSFTVRTKESEIELHELVGHLRKGIQDFNNTNYANKVIGDDCFSTICETRKVEEILRDGTDSYMCTSTCRFSLYEDFGWGKPTWVTVARFTFKNAICLMDTRDGEGIEARVSLMEEEMAFLERDQELLEFASFNPSVLH